MWRHDRGIRAASHGHAAIEEAFHPVQPRLLRWVDLRQVARAMMPEKRGLRDHRDMQLGQLVDADLRAEGAMLEAMAQLGAWQTLLGQSNGLQRRHQRREIDGMNRDGEPLMM